MVCGKEEDGNFMEKDNAKYTLFINKYYPE
jgi:hypothetical protein